MSSRAISTLLRDIGAGLASLFLSRYVLRWSKSSGRKVIRGVASSRVSARLKVLELEVSQLKTRLEALRQAYQWLVGSVNRTGELGGPQGPTGPKADDLDRRIDRS